MGAGRIQEDVTDEGETASLNRVARLMAVDVLRGWPRPKRRGPRGQPVLTPPGTRNLLERVTKRSTPPLINGSSPN